VIELVAPALGGVDGDLELGLERRLPDEFVEPGRPQGRLGATLIGQRGRRGDLDPAQSALAFQRTGRVPGVTSCRAWHDTHLSMTLTMPAATKTRLVESQRVHCHSAVTCGLLDTAIIPVLLVG
jgi:hypothetical protein